MSKTIEQLKEMIDSVITENGKGKITGRGLNLVLNEMTNTMNNNNSNGNGILKLLIPYEEFSESPDEAKKHNAEIYQIIKNKLSNKEPISVGAVLSDTGDGIRLSISLSSNIFISIGSDTSDTDDDIIVGILNLYPLSDEIIPIALYSDGSLEVLE